MWRVDWNIITKYGTAQTSKTLLKQWGFPLCLFFSWTTLMAPHCHNGSCRYALALYVSLYKWIIILRDVTFYSLCSVFDMLSDHLDSHLQRIKKQFNIVKSFLIRIPTSKVFWACTANIYSVKRKVSLYPKFPYTVRPQYLAVPVSVNFVRKLFLIVPKNALWVLFFVILTH